jgi:hypothetical protein
MQNKRAGKRGEEITPSNTTDPARERERNLFLAWPAGDRAGLRRDLRSGKRRTTNDGEGRPPREKPATSLTGGKFQNSEGLGSVGIEREARRRAEICRREGERERAEAPDDARRTTEKFQICTETRFRARRDWQRGLRAK